MNRMEKLTEGSNWFVTEHDHSLTGLRFKLVYNLYVPASEWHKNIKNNKGGLVTDLANYLYSTHGFKYTYCPQVDFKRQCKKGEKPITFTYFFNDVEEARRLGYMISDALASRLKAHEDQMKSEGYPNFSPRYCSR